MIPDTESVAKGTDLIMSGWLGPVRVKLGLSFNALAAMLHSQGAHVKRWTLGRDAGKLGWVHASSALRVAQFARDFQRAQEWLDEEGLAWNQLIPLPTAAYEFGISRSVLRSRMRTHGIEPIELGCLGQWLTRQEAELCRR